MYLIGPAMLLYQYYEWIHYLLSSPYKCKIWIFNGSQSQQENVPMLVYSRFMDMMTGYAQTVARRCPVDVSLLECHQTWESYIPWICGPISGDVGHYIWFASQIWSPEDIPADLACRQVPRAGTSPCWPCWYRAWSCIHDRPIQTPWDIDE